MMPMTPIPPRAVTVSIAAETTTEATEQEDDENDDENGSERHALSPRSGPQALVMQS